LFDGFGASTRARLSRTMRIERLTRGMSLYQPGDVIPEFYLPLSGAMVSLVVLDEDGAAVEAGVTGNEGIVGVNTLLGRMPAAHQAVVQIAGEAIVIPGEPFLREFRKESAVQNRIFGYMAYLIAQISQTALCNRLHSAEERLSRWLLMCQDRAGQNELHLTHDLLSLMLGTRRSTVSLSAGTLQTAGLIRYVHGRLTIVDRAGLESAACSCYGGLRRLMTQYLDI
jgi:CRP-like cAMP-binding protein